MKCFRSLFHGISFHGCFNNDVLITKSCYSPTAVSSFSPSFCAAIVLLFFYNVRNNNIACRRLHFNPAYLANTHHHFDNDDGKKKLPVKLGRVVLAVSPYWIPIFVTVFSPILVICLFVR